MTSIENNREDSFTLGKGFAIAAACLAFGGIVGGPLASHEIAVACDRRDMMAPGGEASPAELCEKNDQIRSIPLNLVGKILPDVEPEPLFADKALGN